MCHGCQVFVHGWTGKKMGLQVQQKGFWYNLPTVGHKVSIFSVLQAEKCELQKELLHIKYNSEPVARPMM